MTIQIKNELRKSGIRGTVSLLIAQISRRHRKRASDLISGLDLHLGQMMILEALWTRGALSQSELAEHSGVRRATMTVALKPLEKAGMIERTSDPDDRRITTVVATDKSRRLRPHLYEVWEQLNRETVSGISPEDLRVFERVLRQVRRNLDAQIQGY